MKMYEKGTQVHATEVFLVKSGALYVDEAKTIAAKKEDVVKAIQAGNGKVGIFEINQRHQIQ